MPAARFVPSLEVTDRAGAVVFAVGVGTVAVVDTDSAESGPDLTSAICLGRLDGRPCFAVAVETVVSR